MAQFGPVAPLPILEELNDAGVLGTYHLLLAHDVVKHPNQYRRLFNKPNMFIIMDNSLIELGHPVDTQTMVDACKIANADVCVLPDYLGDYERTIAATTAVYDEWVSAPLPGFMAVVQGKTFDECVRCINSYRVLDEADKAIEMWSAPKIIQKHLNTRYTLIDKMVKMKCTPIHMLGFSDNLNDDIFCAHSFQDVQGIDSAVPIRLGINGLAMDKTIPAHAPRGDYMESAKHINELGLSNLLVTRQWFRHAKQD